MTWPDAIVLILIGAFLAMLVLAAIAFVALPFVWFLA